MITVGARRARTARIILLTAAFTIIAGAAAVALFIAVQARGATGTLTAQNRQLQGQVASLKAREHSDYTSVGQALAPILPYTTTVCSQDLTGPNGQPTQYFMLCTDQKPSQPAG